MKKKHESFQSGLAVIYDNQNRGGIGNYPKDKLVLRYKLRYRERTVGINRYYAALQDNSRIDRMIRCLRKDDVSVLDVVNIITSGSDDKYYRIAQIQYPEDTEPAVMDLSLERIEIT